MTAIEPMTESQAQALADVLCLMRPGDWKKPQLLKLFWEHRGKHPFPDTALAAARVANNPAIKSPDVIFMPGAHWEMPEAKTVKPKPDPCEDHIGQEAHNCRSCFADIKVGDRPESMLGKRYTPLLADALEASMEDA